jgi:DNA modification methylase
MSKDTQSERRPLELRVEYRELCRLKNYAKNARIHGKKQLHQIARSIEEFGFINPIVIDGNDEIVAGHGRAEAARMVGAAKVPTIRVEHLSPLQIRAYRLADNKLADGAGWDTELIKIELNEIISLDPDVDLEITAFETAEIDLLTTLSNTKADPADDLPEVGVRPVSRVGDLWVLGQHKLLCGDARDPRAYDQLMETDTARMIFTDPPYNVAVNGHVRKGREHGHREFVMASSEMSQEAFRSFLRTSMNEAARVSLDGAIHYICMDWRHLDDLLAATEGIYAEQKNLCVWVKTNGGLGSFYRSQHELVAVFKCGTAPHINNVNLGANGRYRTNVWTYAGVNSFKANREEELGFHPTVKPVAMVIDAIKDCTHVQDIVLDPFGGSGTTLIAAEKCRRRARVMELDPIYVDVIVRRWEKLTGRKAVHAVAQASFETVAAERPSSRKEPA